MPKDAPERNSPAVPTRGRTPQEDNTGSSRKAFFIAYHYPPIRSAGVARTRAFLRHLPEFGYQSNVLTTSAFGGGDEVLRAWEPLSLYRWLFNKEARSGRAHSATRTRSGYLSRLGSVALIPDLQISWLPAAFWRGLRHLRAESSDLIYSSFPPASAHLLALLLKQATGLPWVADFRDSWIFDPLDPRLERESWRRALEMRLEETVLRTADAVVCASEIAAEHLRVTYPAEAEKIRVIANGFETSEFPAAPPPPNEDVLRIVHTGSFSFSHLRRTPGPLFAALRTLLERDPSWPERLQVLLVGALSADEQQSAADLVERKLVQLKGLCEHEEALAFQRSAHVLLLVDHARPWPASNVPGKFYEYLAMRRPLLSLGGSGMVERLIKELNAGLHVFCDDPQAICASLEALYARFSRGQLQLQTRPEDLRRFHRRELTRELARCFDDVVEAR